MADDMLHIFMHIPKTAGTTISDVLRKNFTPVERFDHESYQGEELTLVSLPDDLKPCIRCLMGHYYHGVHDHFPGRRFTYFTMLRNPIERILSQYSFVQTYPGYEYVRGKSFAEYLDLAPEASNNQTLLVGGLPTPDIERAKSNLRSFSAVGITEMFDESLGLFARTFGWTDATYHPVNITKHRLRRDDLSATDIRKAEEKNALDLELYAFAHELLCQRLQG
jgi:hypothetical protein